MPRISRRTVGLPSRPSQADTPTQRRGETPDADSDVDMEASQEGSGRVEQLSRSLVRYALSCEYARKPIKRQDVNERGGWIAVGSVQC